MTCACIYVCVYICVSKHVHVSMTCACIYVYICVSKHVHASMYLSLRKLGGWHNPLAFQNGLRRVTGSLFHALTNGAAQGVVGDEMRVGEWLIRHRRAHFAPMRLLTLDPCFDFASFVCVSICHDNLRCVCILRQTRIHMHISHIEVDIPTVCLQTHIKYMDAPDPS